MAKFNYRWRLSDGYPAPGIPYHGKKCFGTFVCGGGSAMGYKLAGYDYLGGVELDPTVAEVYTKNNHPKLMYVEDIRDFNRRTDLPPELFQLDLLDGSPPCSTFSMVGLREKAWGKEKQFAEGQKVQKLDELVFVYCGTILKLKPKTFLLENVSGLYKGNAKSYFYEINRILSSEYKTYAFMVNAKFMGVPQSRERLFIVGHRKEYDLPAIAMKFIERPITFGEIMDDSDRQRTLTDYKYNLWLQRRPTDVTFCDIKKRIFQKQSLYTHCFIKKIKLCRL